MKFKITKLTSKEDTKEDKDGLVETVTIVTAVLVSPEDGSKMTIRTEDGLPLDLARYDVGDEIDIPKFNKFQKTLDNFEGPIQPHSDIQEIK